MSLLKKILAGLGLLILLVVGYLFYGTVINPKSPKAVATYEKDDLKVEVVCVMSWRTLPGLVGETPFCDADPCEHAATVSTGRCPLATPAAGRSACSTWRTRCSSPSTRRRSGSASSTTATACAAASR